MNKFKKSQLLVLSLLTILLIIAPLLSSSLRLTYIYFITNLLIIALGAEAGLLSFFAKPSLEYHNSNDKKNTNNSSVTPNQIKPGNNNISSELIASLDKRALFLNGSDQEKDGSDQSNSVDQKGRVVEKCLSEKVVGSVKLVERSVKKCPSMPSLFFIGSGDNEGDFDEDLYYQDDDEEEEEQEEVGEISGQELFAKAENFIGNFYKQLKMQREESWKRINGFYQRAF